MMISSPADTFGRFAALSEARITHSPERPRGQMGRSYLAIVVAIVVTMAVLSQAQPAAGSATDGPDFATAHGLYALEDGGHILLLGAHPMMEEAGAQMHLTPAGPDRYLVDATGETLALQRGPGGAVAALILSRVGEAPRVASRATLYDDVPVRFESRDIELAGTVLLPEGPGPHPAVAIVHGAEFGTRETYRVMASYLARQGVAALIYDKRGTGESTGDARAGTFDDLTVDALAAVSLLRQTARIDPDRVGLVGMSQGGWIIADAAIRTDDVAFLVALSASGFTPAEQAAWLTGSMLAVRGLGGLAVDISAKAWAMLYSSVDLVRAGLLDPMPQVPGFWFHALDPHLSATTLWSQVRQPVLGMWGELDCQVPAYDSLAVIQDALDRGPNETYRLVIHGRADHGLIVADACEREIGMSHDGRDTYAEGVLSAPATWIHDVTTGGASEPTVSIPTKRASSPLGWHQSTATSPAWFGSFGAQLAALGALLSGYVLLTLAAGARAVLSLGRSSERGRGTGLIVLSGIVGLVGTVLGALVLVELLALADLHSAPLIGDGPVAGVTPLLALAAGAIIAAVGLGAVSVWRLGRDHGRWVRPRADTMAVGVLASLLAAWTMYWALLPASLAL
jgi:dienelactone hydrolase